MGIDTVSVMARWILNVAEEGLRLVYVNSSTGATFTCGTALSAPSMRHSVGWPRIMHNQGMSSFFQTAGACSSRQGGRHDGSSVRGRARNYRHRRG